jgi:hypothetical protein
MLNLDQPQEIVMLRTSSLRTSGFLAIALSATALVSITVPAAADPSKVFGGNSRVVAQMHPIQATTSIQPSQDASHALGPKKISDPQPKIPTPAAPVYSGLSPGGKLIPAQKYPAGDATKVVKGPQIPEKDKFCMEHPTVDFCHSGQPPQPPVPPPPPPPPHRTDGGPVIILAPQVVQERVAVPYSTSPRVVTGVSSVAVRPQPVVTPHCMTAADIPALAAGIDQLLPTAKLSEADMSTVTELRQTIQLLATDGKVPAARDTEEIAMNILGYQKVWLRCGQGTFDWEPLPVPTQAQATQAK